MAAKEGYDVLRLIEHNQVCYVSSEYARGKPLPRWLKYHPCVKKEELFKLISDIAGQLSQIHRCRENPCYQYVNPYSIIVSEDGQVRFLDVNAGSNGEQLRIMQRRTVREHFLPPEEPYYQKASVELDIYGFGRTLQYVLAETEAEPPLRRTEEARFQKIISRCLDRHSKRPFQSVSDIQKMIPVYRQKKEEAEGSGRLKRAAAAALVITAIGAAAAGGYTAVTGGASAGEKTEEQKSGTEQKAENGQMTGQQEEESVQEAKSGQMMEQQEERLSQEAENGQMTGQRKEDLGQETASRQTIQRQAGRQEIESGQETARTDSSADDTEDSETARRLGLELGTVYFLELEDYEKSGEYFRSIKGDALAGYMTVAADYLAGGSAQPEELRQALLDAEAEIKARDEESIRETESVQETESIRKMESVQETESVRETDRIYRCILKSYAALGGGEDFRNMIRIGEMCLEDNGGEGPAELYGLLADAFEGLGEFEKACGMYKEQLEREKDGSVREAVCQKASKALIKSGDSGRAQELLLAEIKKMPCSLKLRTAYLASVFGESGAKRGACIQKVKEQIKELPVLKEEKEFKRLMKKQGITVKGENVW